MIQAATQTCSLGQTVLNSFFAGEVGSLGFFLNMMILSGVIFFIKKHFPAIKAYWSKPTIVEVKS